MGGLYSGYDGTVNLERRLSIVSHDLANLNTPGHKRSRLIEDSAYPQVLGDLIHRSDPTGFNTATPASTPFGDQIDDGNGVSVIDFSQGELRTTGVNTDFALDGPGFFVVSVDGQERYTRAGSFQVNELGQLAIRVKEQLAPVLGQSGAITLPEGEFAVAADGSVLDENGIAIETLRTVQAADPQRLERIGSTLYVDPVGQAGIRPSLEGETIIRQGALELSNADPVMSLVEMIQIQRTYQAVTKSMTTADESTGRRISMSTTG